MSFCSHLPSFLVRYSKNGGRTSPRSVCIRRSASPGGFAVAMCKHVPDDLPAPLLQLCFVCIPLFSTCSGFGRRPQRSFAKGPRRKTAQRSLQLGIRREGKGAPWQGSAVTPRPGQCQAILGGALQKCVSKSWTRIPTHRGRISRLVEVFCLRRDFWELHRSHSLGLSSTRR